MSGKKGQLAELQVAIRRPPKRKTLELHKVLYEEDSSDLTQVKKGKFPTSR